MKKRKVVVEVCAASEQGGRSSQEDDYIIYQSRDGNITVFGVFDGHSSGGGGADISAALVEGFEILGEKLDSQLFKNPKAFRNFLQVNSDDLDQWLLKDQRKNAIRAGSTACLGFYDSASNTFYAYNVGDSRIVFFELSGGKKKIIKKGTWHQSADHKPGLQSEINRIERAGGEVRSRNSGSSVPRVDGVLALSRSFGDFQLKRPFNKSRGDWVIADPKIMGPYNPTLARGSEFYAAAGSDGIWDQMSSLELTKLILKNVNNQKNTLDKLCKELVNENIERWKRSKGADNVTLVIMRVAKKE
jgi:serine/threonine protein phosphatase PrpC